MTTKFVLFIFICFLLSKTVVSQIKGKNAVFTEIGGNANTVVSVNYDRIIAQGRWVKLTTCTGVGYVRTFYKYLNNSAIGCYGAVNILIGKEKHYAEIGSGITYCRLNYNEYPNHIVSAIGLLYAPRIGYRLQFNASGFSFRLGLTPLFLIKDYNHAEKPFGLFGYLGNSKTYYPWVGISLGYSF